MNERTQVGIELAMFAVIQKKLSMSLGTVAGVGSGQPRPTLGDDQSLALRIQSPSQMMIGVYNRLLRKVFRFHYHSQKVIGSLG